MHLLLLSRIFNDLIVREVALVIVDAIQRSSLQLISRLLNRLGIEVFDDLRLVLRVCISWSIKMAAIITVIANGFIISSTTIFIFTVCLSPLQGELLLSLTIFLEYLVILIPAR